MPTIGSPILAPSGNPAYNLAGNPTYYNGSDCDCCCGCPAGLPTTYTLTFDWYDGMGVFQCHATATMVESVACGYNADLTNPFGGCAGNFAINMTLQNNPCAWRIQVGETQSIQTVHNPSSPVGAYPDLVESIVILRNIVVS